MKLYEIEKSIYEMLNNLELDEETGEVLNTEKLEQLEAEFEDKAENIGLFIKNCLSQAEAIKVEEKALSERRKAKENKAETLKKYLSKCMENLGKTKIETSKVEISIRKSSVVAIDDNFIEWAKANADGLLTYKEPTANKTAIKQAIKDGIDIKHAIITENKNLNIK